MSEERNVPPVENDPTEGMDPYEWMEFKIKTAQETEGYLAIMPNSMDRKKILLGCDPNISDLEFANFKRETMGLRPITDEEWDKLDEDGPAMVAIIHLKHLPNVGTITFTPLLPGEKGKPEVSQVAAE